MRYTHGRRLSHWFWQGGNSLVSAQIIMGVIPLFYERRLLLYVKFTHNSSSLRSPGELLKCLQYKAVEITSPAVEQDTVVYKISMPKYLNFITYFNRRLGTWLQQLLSCQSPLRSEERRVGKECRSRWSPYH